MGSTTFFIMMVAVGMPPWPPPIEKQSGSQFTHINENLPSNYVPPKLRALIALTSTQHITNQYAVL
jgi:hypothetical protein